MAVLLFLLAVAGVALVGDLVLENTAPGTVTVLDHSFGGYTGGQLLAAAAAVGLIVGVLAVASVSLRRARRARRKELHQAEQDLTAEVEELERENRALREQLANYRQSRRQAAAATPADRPPEPVYEEARRVARLRGSDPNR
jgi:type VI protein secretion system component VasK